MKRFEEYAAGRVFRGILRWGMIICSATVTLILVDTVLGRYLFNTVMKGYDELLPIFAMWLYFLGAVYGTYEKSHIRADIVDIFVPEGVVKRVLSLVGAIVVVIVNIIFFLWAIDYTGWALQNMPLSISLRIPLVIPQGSVLVGMTLMLFFNIRNLLEVIRSARDYQRERNGQSG